MKTKLLKFGMPIGLGLMLLTITIMGVVSTTFTGCSTTTTCPSNECLGNDNKCYGPCSVGSCTTTPTGSCSGASAGGVYCCTSGGGGGGGCGSVMGCCPVTGCGTGWYGSSTGLCYSTSSDCHNAGNGTCRQCY